MSTPIGLSICVKCKVLKHTDGKPYGQEHYRYLIDDSVLNADETALGLKTMLVDESVTITGETTVENL